MRPLLLEDIRLELDLLHKLTAQGRPVLDAAGEGRADETEKLAAAAMLQTFCNGVEKVLALIARQADAGPTPPAGSPSPAGNSPAAAGGSGALLARSWQTRSGVDRP